MSQAVSKGGGAAFADAVGEAFSEDGGSSVADTIATAISEGRGVALAESIATAAARDGGSATAISEVRKNTPLVSHRPAPGSNSSDTKGCIENTIRVKMCKTIHQNIDAVNMCACCQYGECEFL